MSNDEAPKTNTDSRADSLPIPLPINEEDDRQATIAAIREGLADVRAGRPRPARIALRELAERYGITLPIE